MPVSPNKTNPPLIVDADRMLPAPVLAQSLKPVSRRYPKITQRPGIVDKTPLAQGGGLDIRRQTSTAPAIPNRLGCSIAEADHHRPL